MEVIGPLIAVRYFKYKYSIKGKTVMEYGVREVKNIKKKQIF